MASARQIQSNQANAKLSTGPNSEHGKAVSRTNAVKHGLQAATFVLPGEDQEEFKTLSDALFAETKPQGMLEVKLAEEVVICLWRLRRARNVEFGLFLGSQSERSQGYFRDLRLSFINNSQPDFFGKLTRYEKAIENSLYRALNKLNELQSIRSSTLSAANELIDVTSVSIVNDNQTE